MAIQFKRLEEVVQGGKVKCLVYGFAGAGKTTLVASLPGRGVLISAEGGLLALRRLVEAGSVVGDVNVVEVANLQDVRDAYSAARDAVAAGQIDWLAIDSLSEVAEALLTAEKAATKDTRKAYGELMDKVGELVRAFRDLACDVYLIAKAEKIAEEDTGRVSVRPMLPGSKLGQALPYLVDEVLFLDIVKDADGADTRVLQCARTPRIDAKDRSGKLDAQEPADLGHILSKIRAA